MPKVIKSYDFKVRIDGKAFALETGFRFNRDMNLVGAGFQLNLIDPDLTILKTFRPGQKAEIEIDGRVIARVKLETLGIDDTNGHVYRYGGRDACGDLIDCSAMFDNESFSKKNVRLEAAVKELLKPFKMDLKVAVDDTGKPFNEVAITPGETVFDVIDRLCRYRALRPLSDGVGGLILSRAGNNKSGGAITAGENVITRDPRISHTQRFSEIIVKGSSNGDGGSAFGDTDAKSLSSKEGRAKDPDIKDYRPLIIQSESDGYDLDLKSRAEWEIRHRRFTGTEITYTVPGWEATDGVFWKINTTVPVYDPKLNIDRHMLIKTVELIRDGDGTKTNLTVAPAEAFDLPAIRQSEDDDIWGGGA